MDDVVAVLEKDTKDHPGVIQALRDCNASLRDKLDVAIEEHQVLRGLVFELEEGRARQKEVWQATNQQLQDLMLEM